jgi:hypothetical protein
VGPEFPLELGSMLFCWVYSPRKAEDFLAQHVIGGYGTKWDSGFPLVLVFVTPSFLNFVGSSSICVFPLVLVFVTPSFLNFLEFLSPLLSWIFLNFCHPFTGQPSTSAWPQPAKFASSHRAATHLSRCSSQYQVQPRAAPRGLQPPRYSSEPFLLNH